MSEKIIIVSGPVVIKDNKVLLNISGDDNDFWKFCGGKIEVGETLVETAQRRVKEEMGIDIEIKNEEPFFMYTKKPNQEDVDVVLVHFLSKAIGEVKPGKEVQEWEWVSIEELQNKNLAPNIIPALKHFGFIKK